MVPRHVAVIMDGNRRFSKRLMIKPWKGHEWGAKKLEELINWCREIGIAELTVYAFSVQNFNRPKEEFDFLMRVFVDECKRLKERIASGEKDMKVNFIGRLHMFPPVLQSEMNDIMRLTAQNKGFVLNLAMAYGGREEVIDAVKKLAESIAKGDISAEQINEKVFEKQLYIDSEPELVIRTGGDHRTSNFLIWQSHYSEWFFVEKLWPEFEKQDFLACIESFEKRERRFGR